MNNKSYLAFILALVIILSALPFKGSLIAPLIVHADSISFDSTSQDFAQQIVDNFKNTLGGDGVVADPSFYDSDFWQLINDFYDWGTTPIGTTINRLHSTGKTPTQIVNEVYNYIYADIESQLPYFIYHTLPIDKFFSFFDFSNYAGMSLTLGNYKNALENLCSDSDCVYLLSQHGNSFNYLYDTQLVSVSSDFLENYAFILHEGSFSIFPDKAYQSIVIRSGDTVPTFTFNGILKFYNGVDFADTSLLGQWLALSKNGGNDFDRFVKCGPIPSAYPLDSNLSFRCGAYNNSTGWFSNDSFRGTAFISVGDSIELLVFKSGASMNAFYSGNSKFYTFDSGYDLSNIDGIDYDKLFDAIKDNVHLLNGSLNDFSKLVDDNLKKQLELLGDINDALRTPEGEAWLRKIYLFLSQDLKTHMNFVESWLRGFSGSSGSGGGLPYEDFETDMQDIKDLLDEMNHTNIVTELEDYDIDNPKFEDLINSASHKFPFSIIGDINLLMQMFNAEPVESPHISIPYFNGTSVSSCEIDFSFYSDFQPYVYGACAIAFIVLLVVLSIKIFGFFKG